MTVGSYPSYETSQADKNIIVGNTVSCSSPSYASGTVKATPIQDWTAERAMIFVDFGGGTVIWVKAGNCTVTG